MAKDSKIQVNTYRGQASNFWLGRDFDTNFKSRSGLDYTKLAAAQRAIGNFVNIVTGKQIPVAFQNNDSSYTDGKTVVIGTSLDGKNFDPAVGLALHEGSHIAYTDFLLFAGAKSLSGSPFATYIRFRGLDPELTMTEKQFGIIKDLLNWVEDRRIDYKVYTQAPGYRAYYEAMYNRYFNDKIIDKALKAGEKVKEDWDCYMFHIINFTNPNRQLNALSKLKQIWNVVDLQNIQRLESTKDALDVAIEIFKIVQDAVQENASDDQDDNNSGKKSSSSSSSSSSSGSSSSGLPSISSNEDSDSDENADEDNDVDSDEDNDEGEDADADSGNANTDDNDSLSDKELKKLEDQLNAQREFLNGTQKKTGRLSKQQSALVNAMRESGTETRDVYTDRSGTMHPVTTVVIKKLTPSLICSMPELFASGAKDMLNGSHVSTSVTQRINKTNDAVVRGIKLGRQLGSKLQLRNSERSLKSTRLQTGKIDRRLVAQLGFDNANVFHRIVTDRYKNYFMHISIDASGSMGGNRFEQAITSAVAIAQAASMTTGIRIQISFRGTENLSGKTERCVTMYAYDSAHDKMSKIKTLFKYLKVFGCTPEGLAFKSIEADIKKDARGDELIFINYSDGEPSNVQGVHNSYSGKEFTQRVVKNMRSNGFNVISYFINETGWDSSVEAFKYMYGQDAQFIRTDSMTDVAKTMNAKFLEIAD